jgi:hypothetical protein
MNVHLCLSEHGECNGARTGCDASVREGVASVDASMCILVFGMSEWVGPVA